MAYDFFDFGNSDSPSTTLQIDGSTVELSDASFVRDAAIVREGADLVLDGPNGTITVEGYFNAAEAPDLVTPEGYTLTPELVESFARSPSQYAQSETFNDVSPVGAVDEITGEASITRMDGSVEPITIGTPVYQGDVIETSADGAVNISFIDETSFAVSEEARLAIDEYVFDPATEAGTQNFSVLKGVFVFTSGLIGRDDPDDVNIDTPSGSIGIRGTIIAGNADTGEITVVEGAIVVRDLKGNEITLDQQFETAQINPTGGVDNMGLIGAKEMADRFEPVSKVAPALFSSINDAMAEQAAKPAPKTIDEGVVDANPSVEEGAPEGPKPNVDGSVDQNNDNSVDGTVNEGPVPVDGSKPAGEPVDPANTSPDGTTGEMEAPKPPPMPTGQMGMDPMGTNTGGMGSTMPPPPDDGTTTAAGGAGAAGAMDPVNTAPPPPPPPPSDTTSTDTTQDPTTIVPPPPGNADVPPLHIQSNLGGIFTPGQVNIAPSNPGLGSTNYFRVGENQQFDYAFDLEFAFQGPAGNSSIGYSLGATTITDLDLNFGAGNWSFVNGRLTITNTGTTADVNAGAQSDDVIMIDITAANSAGSASASYALQLYSSTGGSALVNNTTLNNTVLTGSPTADVLNIGMVGTGANGNVIFAGNGDDNLTLVEGANNDIHLGNTVTTQNNLLIQDNPANIDNNVYGGSGEDSVRFDDARNSFFGLDGDDTIKIDLGTSAASQLNGSLAGYVVDLGHSSFAAGDQLRANGIAYNHAPGDTGGYGDTLFIEGTGGALDFQSSIAPGYFRGVERIDVKNSGVTALVNLDYQDIVEMTDYKNTLIIRADGGDNLGFSGPEFAAFSKVGDNITLDDNYDGNGNDVFDVWTDGNVTLLIEDVGGDNNASGASVTGLP